MFHVPDRGPSGRPTAHRIVSPGPTCWGAGRSPNDEKSHARVPDCFGFLQRIGNRAALLCHGFFSNTICWLLWRGYPIRSDEISL